MIFLVHLGLLSSCSLFQKNLGLSEEYPRFTIERVNLVRIEPKTILFSVFIAVYNPNTFSLNISDLTYKVLDQNSSLVEGRIEKPIHILASDVTRIDLPIRWMRDQTHNQLTDLSLGLVKKKLTLDVQGLVHTSLGSYQLKTNRPFTL